MLGARGWITLVALLAVPLPGCGTLLIDNPQKVVITSGPPGARVEIDGAEKGVTPLEVQLTTDKSYDVVVTASGYPPQARVIRRSIKALYIVGDILLAVIPLIVDIATDSLHTLSPKEIHVQFEPVVGGAPPRNPPQPPGPRGGGRGGARPPPPPPRGPRATWMSAAGTPATPAPTPGPVRPRARSTTAASTAPTTTARTRAPWHAARPPSWPGA